MTRAEIAGISPFFIVTDVPTVARVLPRPARLRGQGRRRLPPLLRPSPGPLQVIEDSRPLPGRRRVSTGTLPYGVSCVDCCLT